MECLEGCLKVTLRGRWNRHCFEIRNRMDDLEVRCSFLGILGADSWELQQKSAGMGSAIFFMDTPRGCFFHSAILRGRGTRNVEHVQIAEREAGSCVR